MHQECTEFNTNSPNSLLYMGFVSCAQGWQSVGLIRFPDMGLTEISCSQSCSDLEIYSKIGFVSGSFYGLSIVGRTVLNLKFTGIQSVNQACIVGLPEIWY